MAAYTPYDLLRTLIERAGWPREAEKIAAMESVAEWERMHLFGDLATITACAHDGGRRADGSCEFCGSARGETRLSPRQHSNWRG